MEFVMEIAKNKKKYEEHIKSKFCIVSDTFINTDYPCDNEDINDMYYNNAEVLFAYDAPERRSAFYPGAEAEVRLWGVKFKNKYFLKKELPSKLVDWIEEHLWENIPEKHKSMP